MPTILSNKPQPGLLPSNPGEAEISPAQFGKTQDAIARVGGVVADLGNQYVEAKAKAEEADAVMNQTLTDSRAVDEKKKAIQSEYMVDDGSGALRFDPRGKPSRDDTTGDLVYPDSFSKRMEEVVREQYQSGLEAMPSQRARRSYQQSADGMVIREVNQALNFEQMELSRFIIQNKDKFQAESAQQVRQNPSLDNLSEKVAGITKYFKENEGALFDPARASAEHKKSVRDIIKEGYFEGMLDASPEQGLAVLNSIGSGNREPAVVKEGVNASVFGTGGSPSEMASFLDADDINNLRDRFESKIKEKNVVEIHSINNKINDMKVAAANGQNVGGIAGATALIARQEQLGAFKSPEEKVRAYSDVVSSVVIGQAKSKMAGMTNEQIAEATKNAEALYKSEVQKAANKEGIKLPPEFAAGDSLDVKTKIAGAVNQVLRERQVDPAKSAMEGNRTLAKSYDLSGGGLGAAKEMNENYFAESLSEQQRLGSVNPRPLPVESAKALAGQIASVDANRSSVMIEDLKVKTGKYFPQVMNQLMKDGKLPEYYATASYIDSPEAGRAIIDGMRNKGTYEAVLKDNGLGYKKSEITNAVNQNFDSYYKSMVSAGPSGENNRIASAIRQAAYYQAANLVSRGVGADEAAATAVDVIIRNKYEVFNGAMIPRENSETAKASMNYVSTDEFVNMNVEKIYLPQAKGMEKQSPTTQEQFSALSEKAKRVKMALQDPNGHTWMNKEDGSGAVLNFRIRNPQNPLGFDLIPVRTNSGKNVEIDWKNPKVKVGE